MAICIMTSMTSWRLQPTFNAPLNVNLQLGGRIPERSQCGNDSKLARFEVQARTGVDVSEGEFDQVACEVRGNVLQALDYTFAGFPIHLFEFFPATPVTILTVHRHPPSAPPIVKFTGPRGRVRCNWW